MRPSRHFNKTRDELQRLGNQAGWSFCGSVKIDQPIPGPAFAAAKQHIGLHAKSFGFLVEVALFCSVTFS